MAAGRGVPSWVLSSRTVCIPQREFLADAQGVVRKAGALRLITLMKTTAKVLARQLDIPLSGLAAHSVAIPQRGFIRGKNIDDNLFELEGAFVEYSCMSRSAAMLLLDFRAAFPSLDREFMVLVLERFGVPITLLRAVRALYHDLVTFVVFAGESVAEMRMDSGIKQGCPLSGTLFALALDPMVRRYLAEVTMASSRLCAFADDVGVAMRDFACQLRELLELFEQWGRASALRLSMKCMLIPDGPLDVARAVVDANPMCDGLQVAHSGTYLGLVVGPAAMQTQWDEVLVKARRRVADIRMQGQSMAARVYLYKAYVASLYLYKARFVDVLAAVLRAYKCDMQRITCAPWQAINTQMLHDLSVLGQARGVRDFGYEASLAKVRAAASNPIFLEVVARVERATAHEDAFLDPRRPWHAGTVVVAGRHALQAIAHAGHGHLLAAGRFAKLRRVCSPRRTPDGCASGPRFCTAPGGGVMPCSR